MHGLILLSALCISSVVRAGEWVDRDFSPQSYPNSDHRDFLVYVPSNYDHQTIVPMVMVLHGCQQTHHTVKNEFGWEQLAEQHDFILVVPDISTSDPFRNTQCWGYWEPKEIHQGSGEVEDLLHIGMQVEQKWHIDPNRRHIVGLSSGGFMANAAAVAHNEYWASAGVHSGGGYNESVRTYAAYCHTRRASSGQFKSPVEIAADMRAERDNNYTIPMMLIHSQNDCSVGYGVEGDPSQWGGLTSNRGAWLSVNGGTLFSTTDCTRDGIECRHQKFGSSGRSTLEVVRINGMIAGTEDDKGHYWSGGHSEGRWTKTPGAKAAGLFWNFFQHHPRRPCATCPVAPWGLMATQVDSERVALSWHSNPEVNMAGYFLYRNGLKVSSNPIPLARYEDTRLQQATTYTYVVTAINGAGDEGPFSSPLSVQTCGTLTCRSYDASLEVHTTKARAYKEEKCIDWWWCGFWPWPKKTAFYATGSQTYLGHRSSSAVTLYTMDGQNFDTQACQSH